MKIASDEYIILPPTSAPQKKTATMRTTIATSPIVAPIAIPAMAPGDSDSDGPRAAAAITIGETSNFRNAKYRER